eukprot:gene11880-15855_t
MLVGFAGNNTEIKEAVLEALGALKAPPAVLFSTLGRTAARGIEARLCAKWGLEFFDSLLALIKAGDTRTFTKEKWDPATWPAECRGVGTSEAPRGALAHWIVIKDRKIENYQLVVPSTWNASPRDGKGQRSAYEASLIGTPVHDAKQPLEIIRTIHSFDPCLACAVHLYEGGAEVAHHELLRVYVWEQPVRWFHWINAASVLALGATGWLIAHPPAFLSAQEASFSYWFGTVRFLHFLFGYIFAANFAFRLYWSFVGNKFAHWRNFLPMTAAQIRQIWAVLKVDVFQSSNK